MHQCQESFGWQSKSMRFYSRISTPTLFHFYLSLRHADNSGCREPCLQVVSEYRKARAIMADVAVEGATEGVWHNLFLEVDKVASHKHTHRDMMIQDFHASTMCCRLYIWGSALHNM